MKLRHILFTITLVIPVLSFSQTAEELVAEGKKLKEDKKSVEAMSKFQQALNKRSDYTEARYELAWCQNDTKSYNTAMSNLRIVRQSWPGIAKVHFELGYAFEKTNMYDSAKASYYKCLGINPNYSNVYKQLGYIEYQQEDYTTALSHFKKHLELKNDEIKDYLFWYRKGFMENTAKDYSAAKISLNNSVKYKNDYQNTWLELGFACKNLKEDDLAIGYYNEAMKIDPKSHIPYNGIGEVYRDNKKNMQEAMNWYNKSLGVKAKERKACFGMGYCLNSLERYSEAIPYLQTAIEQENTYTAAYTELGYAFYKTGKYDDAIAKLNYSISLNPSGVNPHYYLTLIYVAQKNKSKAQEMVNALKRIGSKYVDELQKKVNTL